MPSSRCLIGVGSPHGDDQIGWLVADRLMSRGPLETRIEKVVSPLEILDRIEDVDWLGICDACQGTGLIGAWTRWTWPVADVVRQSFTGSHGISLSNVLTLGRTLGRLPQTVVIWGVEVDDCRPAAEISQAVLAAIEPVAAAIRRELNSNQD